MVREELPAPLDGQRVDRVVSMLTGCSRAEATTAVGDGQVLLDGMAVVRPSSRVTAGQLIEVLSDPAEHRPGPPGPDPAVVVDVVHADAHVLVVDKQAGLVVHPGAGNEGSTLVNGLLARHPEVADVGDPFRPGIVHRLDKGTSGLMVVARTTAAYDALVEQLARHEVQRHYLTLVAGTPEHRRGMVDAPIARSRRDPTRMATVADGRAARTRYEVLSAYTEPVPCALVECQLETGRTHQIRVHLKAIGHPVVGDDRYGRHVAAVPLERPFLHSAHLSFAHPVDGTPLAFDSPLPPDLARALALLS